MRTDGSCESLAPTECAVGDERADTFGCRNVRCDEPGGADCEAMSGGLQSCAPEIAEGQGLPLSRWGCAIVPNAAGAGGAGGSAGAAGAAGTTGASGGASGSAGVSASGASGSGGTDNAGSAGEGGHGDAPLDAACMQDSDCACGSCVQQRCASRPGVCVPHSLSRGDGGG